MADERSNTPESFINDIEAGVEKKFTAQLEDLRRQVRDARDQADAERICGQNATAEMTARMAEYRRGRWYDIGAVVGSAVVGFTVGYETQKFADWRPFGLPAAAVPGALLDESVVTRSVFAVGGTMYMLGATTYVLTHPQTEQV
jgi:F0F1-type ATP synthase assembly protein I